MSPTEGAVPLTDPGNALLLAPCPVMSQFEFVRHPVHGPKIVATFRTPSTTLTLILAKDDAEEILDNLRRACAEATGLIVPPNTRTVTFG